MTPSEQREIERRRTERLTLADVVRMFEAHDEYMKGLRRAGDRATVDKASSSVLVSAPTHCQGTHPLPGNGIGASPG